MKARIDVNKALTKLQTLSKDLQTLFLQPTEQDKNEIVLAFSRFETFLNQETDHDTQQQEITHFKLGLCALIRANYDSNPQTTVGMSSSRTLLEEQIHYTDLCAHSVIQDADQSRRDQDKALILILKLGANASYDEMFRQTLAESIRVRLQLYCSDKDTKTRLTRFTTYLNQPVLEELKIISSSHSPGLDNMILGGYHVIETQFNNVMHTLLNITDNRNDTNDRLFEDPLSAQRLNLNQLIAELRHITLDNYLHNVPNFDDNNSQKIAINIGRIIGKIHENTLTDQDITEFKLTMAPYHTCSDFSRRCTQIISILAGLIVGAALGVTLGAAATIAAGAIIGGGIGFKAAPYLTMWYEKETFQKTKHYKAEEQFIENVSAFVVKA